MSGQTIGDRVRAILAQLPRGVTLVAAAKTRTADEVSAAIRAGIIAVGHNYVQEAAAMIPLVPERTSWHMIGHLQRNKVKQAVALFDMIETMDSTRLAEEIDRRCAAIGKMMDVLIEVNIAHEESKTGVRPDEVDVLVQAIAPLEHIRIRGLMTMGPRTGDPEESRPYFQAARAAFERLTQAKLPRVEMRYLSMGMSNSYRVAIEEGANMVRIGTLLFGERPA